MDLFLGPIHWLGCVRFKTTFLGVCFPWLRCLQDILNFLDVSSVLTGSEVSGKAEGTDGGKSAAFTHDPASCCRGVNVDLMCSSSACAQGVCILQSPERAVESGKTKRGVVHSMFVITTQPRGFETLNLVLFVLARQFQPGSLSHLFAVVSLNTFWSTLRKTFSPRPDPPHWVLHTPYISSLTCAGGVGLALVM